jgi:hypothetical protein
VLKTGISTGPLTWAARQFEVEVEELGEEGVVGEVWQPASPNN